MTRQPLTAIWRLAVALALVADGRVDIDETDGQWIVPPQRSGARHNVRWAKLTQETLNALLRNQLIHIRPASPATLTRLGRLWLTSQIHHELEEAR